VELRDELCTGWRVNEWSVRSEIHGSVNAEHPTSNVQRRRQRRCAGAREKWKYRITQSEANHE